VRASFELKILAATLTEARADAYRHIAAFAECEPAEVPEKADVELKIKTLDLSEDAKVPVWSRTTDLYEVTVYGTLKQSVLRPL
jgi:hypothetical protein